MLILLLVAAGYKCIVFFFIRWDNGETEKLSPWDVEPIPEDGN